MSVSVLMSMVHSILYEIGVLMIVVGVGEIQGKA
jgi:hypothetical protein